MRTGRKAHQCSHPGGCDSEAAWQMDIGFMTIGLGDYRHEIKCHSTIRVCGNHLEAAQKRVMSPANRIRIAEWMTRQNLPLPDFSSVEILWNRVDHDAIDQEIADVRATEDMDKQLKASVS